MSQLVNQAGQKIAFPANGDALVLGKGADSCRVLKTLRGYLVQGSASTNVKVNGQKVQEHLLKEGDVIQLGQSSYTFSAVSAPAAAAPPKKGTERRMAPAGAPPRPTTARVVAGSTAASAGPATRSSQKLATATPAPAPAPSNPPTRSGQRPGTGVHKPAAAKPATSVIKPATQPIKTATDRVAKPATANIRPGTQRVEQPPRTSTARLRPGTQRVEGQPKPTTGRHLPPKSRRVQVAQGSKGLGAIIPKTTKGKIIAGSGLLVLVAAIGVLAWFASQIPDPKKITEELKVDLAKLEAMADDEIIKKHGFARELLAIEKYREHGDVNIYGKLKRIETDLGHKAKDYREAMEKAGPFLDMYEKDWASKVDTAEKSDISELYSKIKPLADKYDTVVTIGPKLAAIKQKLLDLLAKTVGNWQQEITKLIPELNSAERTGEFVDALKKADEFGVKYGASREAELQAKITDLKADLLRKAEKFVRDLLKEAEVMVGENRRAEALKKVGDAKAQIPDGTDGRAKMDDWLRKTKP